MPSTSILAFIVPRLVVQAENAASDCLAYLLSHYPEAGEAFTRLLSPLGVPLPSDLEYSTQVPWDRGAVRPDIVGKSDGTALVIVEAKFDAPLTKNQPAGYVRCLPHERGGVLLFLVPEQRRVDMWPTLVQRAGKHNRLTDLGEVPPGMLAARLNVNHAFCIMSWESLMHEMRAVLKAGENQRAIPDLDQLSALCGRLLSGELTGSSSAFVQESDRDKQMRAVADAITRRLVSEGHAVTKGYRATPGPGYYKCYMSLSGKVNWCVEYNMEYWARFGESLIWLSTSFRPYNAAVLPALSAQLANTQITLRNQFLIPLTARYSRSVDEAVAQMATQAAAVAKVLATLPSQPAP
jgi:hypothetical protein